MVTVIFGLAVVLNQNNLHQNYFGKVWSLISGVIGIAGGTLVYVTGAVGIASYKDPQNSSKNGVHMTFSILACSVSVVEIGVFAIGVR